MIVIVFLFLFFVAFHWIAKFLPKDVTKIKWPKLVALRGHT